MSTIRLGRNAGLAERAETFWVTAAAVLALGLALAVWTVRGSDTGMPAPLDWQVSAFTDLGPDDQAIHSALVVAAVDIGWYNYDFNAWPTPEELDELLMPPFQHDAFWLEHGEIDWQRRIEASTDNGGATAYLGSGGHNPGQSAFLLVFQHRHVGVSFATQAEVWVHDQINPTPPDSYKSESLVRAGWRQVVAYSGADEVTRLKGN